MTFTTIIKRYLLPPRFDDEEQVRHAGILNALGIAIAIGLCIMVVVRVLAGKIGQVLPLSIFFVAVLGSLYLSRRGLVKWAGGLLLWALIGVLDYFLS